MPEFPRAYIKSVSRRLQSAVLATESPFSFAQQVQDMGGERWVVGIDCLVEGLGFEAFANATLNKRRAFDLSLPKAMAQTPPPATALVVDGAGQRGGALRVRGAWAGHVLRAGDFLSLGGPGAWRLHQLVADAQPDGLGGAMLAIIPKLRSAPADGAPVELAAPRVTLRATGPAPATIGFAVHQFTIDATEAL